MYNSFLSIPYKQVLRTGMQKRGKADEKLSEVEFE
jgi:hypothetical protein